MKKAKILYLFWIMAIATIAYLGRNYTDNEVITFHGVAETRALTVNLADAVEVKEIKVIAGQYVKEGDLIANLHRSDLQLRINEIKFKKQEMEAMLIGEAKSMRSEINRLKALNDVQKSGINNRIKELDAEYELNKALVKQLKSLETDQVEKSRNINIAEVKREGLEEELALSSDPIDIEIKNLESRYHTINNPIRIQIRKLEEELHLLLSEEENLSVYAQSSGVVGAVLCKVGERLSPFTPIVTVNEQRPSFVTGYLHEGLYADLEIGDSIMIQSTLHPDHQLKGVLAALGTRIVEFPERLRRYSDVKLWGREVQVRIPQDNDFLQSEKVVLNLIHKQLEVTYPDSKSLRQKFALGLISSNGQ